MQKDYKLITHHIQFHHLEKKDTKEGYHEIRIKNITYICEVWLLKAEEEIKLLALETDYLRRSTRCPDYKSIPNTAIRSKMQAGQSILNRIQRRQLKCYGHLLRMEKKSSAKDDLTVDTAQ